MRNPSLKAIFHRQIAGDHALLQLARQRFQQARLAPEYYPSSPAELRAHLLFHPAEDDRYTVHLPRDIKLLDRASHDRITTFAAEADDRALGFVIHDQAEIANQFSDCVAAAKHLDGNLRRASLPGVVFIEYAAGLEPETFIDFHRALRDCTQLSACVDISHIAVRQCQRSFERLHPGIDACQLKPHYPPLRELVDDLQAACRTALPAVAWIIYEIGRLEKLLHFHLHDGHPSSTFSEYGVSDHLSFFREIPIPFSYKGRQLLPTFFGPLGLREVINAARRVLPDDKLSFTLEIHPPEGRQPLGEYEQLFRHWRDWTNAERMHFWIEELLRNHQLLMETLGVPCRWDAAPVLQPH